MKLTVGFALVLNMAGYDGAMVLLLKMQFLDVETIPSKMAP